MLRYRESDTLLALRGNHDRVGEEVAQPLGQGGLKLVRSHRKEDNTHRQFSGIQFLVGELFELQ